MLLLTLKYGRISKARLLKEAEAGPQGRQRVVNVSTTQFL